MPKTKSLILVKDKINKLIFFNKDQEEKKQYYSKVCKAMIQNLWNGLCEIPNFKESKYEEEIEAYHGLKDIGIPTHGYIDLYGEYVIETKTLWPRRGKVKLDGTRSWSSKSPPAPEKISIDHLSQVALYHAAKNKPVYLVYASDKTWKTYHKGNCPALEPENLKKVLKQYFSTSVNSINKILYKKKHFCFSYMSLNNHFQYFVEKNLTYSKMPFFIPSTLR